MADRVLVTGGAGFIGSTLVRKLLAMKYRITVLDNLNTGLAQNLPRNVMLKLVKGDVRDFDFVSRVIRNHSYVFHLAAEAFIPFSYQMPHQVAEVNAMGSLNVLRACSQSGIKRVVHISSSEVYGPAQHVPMDEKHPLQPCSTYSVAKLAADLWAQTFFWEHKLPVVILRPFNIFGPRENLPYFIPEMIRQCLKEKTIRVGNLETSRDFTYVEDATNAIIKVLEIEDIEGEIINIGTSRTKKMREILTLIKKETGAQEKQVTQDESRLRPKDVEKLVTGNFKAKKLLGWTPRTTFEEGIRKTIQWYKDNEQAWGYEKRGWKWRY